MSIFKTAGPAKRKCQRCEAVAAEASVLCSNCGVTLAGPPNAPVLKDNRWEPGTDELAAFFGIGQLKGIFTKTLNVPLGARALVVQEDTITEVPSGTYEVEGFFSRLANLLRDRPAEILITRDAALLVPFELSGVTSAEFLKLDATLAMGIKVGDVAAFAGQFMGRPGSVTTSQLRELLQPAIHQALAEFTSAYSLRELAANPSLRATVEARLLGNPGLKATLAGLGLEMPLVTQVALKHDKFDANRALQGSLWLVADERRTKLEHAKQLNELYSEEEWAAIERERSEIAARLRRQQMQADERVDSSKLDQSTREQMQTLRERDIELYDRVLASKTRQQALDLGASEQIQVLEHELKGRNLLREGEAEQWEQVQKLAKLRRAAEANITQIQLEKQVSEQILIAKHTLNVQQLQQEVEEARLIDDEAARQAEVKRAKDRLDDAHARGRELAASQHAIEVQTLRLERESRQAASARQQSWESLQALTKELDVKRHAFVQDAKAEDEAARIHGARQKDDANWNLNRWKELQSTKLSLASQAALQALEQEIKRQEMKEREADAEMERELKRIREHARLEAERQTFELRKLDAERDLERDRIKAFAGMSTEQILAAQAGASQSASGALGEFARAQASGAVTLQEAMRLKDEAQERERKYQAEILAAQRAHELEIVRQRDLSAAHAISQQTALGSGVAGAQSRGAQPPVIVPPVVAGVGPSAHFYPGTSMGQRQPCPLCPQNPPEARFCSHCGYQLRT